MRIGSASEALPVHALPEPATEPKLEAKAPDGASFATVLAGMGRELDRGEATTSSAIRGASAGAGLSAGELIALQAGIYRYSEVVDLATKLVDRATSSVKTTLQNQ